MTYLCYYIRMEKRASNKVYEGTQPINEYLAQFQPKDHKESKVKQSLQVRKLKQELGLE